MTTNPCPAAPAAASVAFNINDSTAWFTGVTLECCEAITELFDAIRTQNLTALLNALGEIPGPSSPLSMLSDLWVDEECSEAATVLEQGLAVLRPVVMMQDEDDYRSDVQDLVRTVARASSGDRPSAAGDRLLVWLNAVLHERATDLAHVGANACEDEEDPEAILAVVQVLEDQQLRTALGSRSVDPHDPLPTVPRARL